MSDYKVKNNIQVFFQHLFSGFVFFYKRIKTCCFLFAVCSCTLLSQKAIAQDDSLPDSSEEEVIGDSTKTENGFDTSGYYFNWKENSNEAFTKQKINSRISSDTTIQRLRNEDDFWYIKSVEKFKKDAERLRYDRRYRDSLSKAGAIPPDEQDFTKEPTGEEWYRQPWFSNLIWVVIVSIFVAAVVYFLLSNKINLFSKRDTKQNDPDTTKDELLSVNYDSLLTRYVAEKNYRLAVRVLYLQVLKMLNERSIISYQPQLTNTHYLQQLATSSLYKNFFTVTRHYEYIWYGEFSISDTAFQKINSDFENMKKEVLSK